ncbi:SDR family NAD(P)-dependent oxidoreductase [Sphingomicrobium aestuariivivum]|uniref:SDR family NAD(P)-dependent oxidoreductase n=1 Tax=Sphingomicrobium aestuariivivum TaxID=1582356 RepID=UPI001FD655D4|nr:SDR family NAD(P)-dependent oxidoreductase [Sphingomicrobium aestuariivivum]MCJ8191572.1 SDR family NAD(P)-dependent oxidoreductase [Sphingomicrobium aestuariivivum]
MGDFSNAIIIGASGGIGAAMADAIEARGGRVTRLSRRSEPALDFADPATIAAAASALEAGAPYDAVIIATGLLHDDGWGPEKSWKMLEADPLEAVFRVNTIGPMLVARHFLPLLPRKKRSLFAMLGARVGSIADNRLGGWYGYRASKAALAQFARTLSIELARTHEVAVVAALHPGTVDTALSEPFQANVPEGQLFTPAKSAAHLLDVLEGLTPADSGGHFDWAGERVPA